jgi:chaperonin cofactor prefoldin
MSMTSILRGNVVRILILALALFGTCIALVAFSQTTDSNTSDYVTIKLKDGRVLEGPVLLEDDQQITIEAQFANGTITRKYQIDKNDIASISHLSAVDRDQRLATVAYHDLGKYQLDPKNSYPLSYYDSAITDGFRRFLTQYPRALEAATVTNRLAEWQEERDKVVSGQVKYHGQWMPAAEATKLAETERTQQIVQDARALMAQGQFEAATERLAPYYNASQPSPLVVESRRLQADVYRLWISSLETAQEQLTKDLEATKDRVARLTEIRSRAQANYDQARGKSMVTGTRALGDSAISSQASADYLRAEKQYNEEQNRQFAIQEQLDNTIHQLRQVHQNQDLFTAAYPAIEVVKETAPPPKTNAPAPPPPPQTNVPAPPPPPPPPPTVLEQMGDWFSRNWIIVAGVALLGLWGVSRLFTRP